MATHWTWPPHRAIMLYHWSWFDPAQGDVVVGWSRSRVADEHGFVHLEAERTQPARSLEVDRDLDPIVEPHSFTSLAPLPPSLLEDDGRPLGWVRNMLGHA